MWSVMAFETGTLLLAAVLFLPGLQAMFAVADLSVHTGECRLYKNRYLDHIEKKTQIYRLQF